MCMHVYVYTSLSIGCRTLLATHFHKLTQNVDPGIGCYRVVAQCNENGEILLTYKIEV